MSSITTTPHKIPQPIKERLDELRNKLVQFLLVDGLSRLLLVIVLLVLVDVGIDRFFKMDFSQRLIMLIVISGVVLAVVFYRLLRPFFRRASDDALILQVEERNEQLKESVISSAQFSRDPALSRHGISPDMVDATIKHGAKMAQNVNFANAIDRRAHSRNLALLLAGIIGLGLIGVAVASTDFWNLWFRRNVLLTNDQWPKSTRLTIVGVNGNEIVLPRGEDHQQLVEVQESSSVTDVDVSIEFDDGLSRTHQKMRPTGKLDGRQHLLVFRNLSNEFRFRAKGGDDVTDWVQVRLVEPPGWSHLSMRVRLPEYTGITNDLVLDGSGPHSILHGSSLSIAATANKSLSVANLKLDETSWKLPQLQDGEYALDLAADELAGGKYAFDLADQSGLRSSRPATFTLKIKPDRAPNVRATLRGISGSVVPRARIPISFTATDEFSITRAEFYHIWKADSADSVPQEGTIDLGDLNKQIGNADIQALEALDLEPLNIPIGVGLRVAVLATDNNTLTGPGIGKSREFLLRVVSEEELREDLLRREIEQRKAFELAMRNQEELRIELKTMAAALEDSSQAPDSEQREKNLRDWLRLQKLIGTNISNVADRFDEFLIEVKNNRLDEAEREIQSAQSIETRFNENIIDPIRQLDHVEIIRAAQQIDGCQRSINDTTQLVAGLDTVTNTQDTIIEAMQRILSAMEDSETYQEVVNRVIEIKRNEEDLRDRARKKRQESGVGDIFDDDGDGGGLSDDEKTTGEQKTDKKGNQKSKGGVDKQGEKGDDG